jgi:hypothetical protein
MPARLMSWTMAEENKQVPPTQKGRAQVAMEDLRQTTQRGLSEFWMREGKEPKMNGKVMM